MKAWRRKEPYHILVSSQRNMVMSYPFVPVNATLFGNRIYVDVMKLRWSHIEKKWGFFSKKTLDSHHTVKMSCDDEDWIIDKPRNAKDYCNHQRLGRNNEGVFPKAFRDSMSQLTPWFWTSVPRNCERINLFQATQFVVICNGSPRRQTQLTPSNDG
jgi:hypothetical protein